MVRQRGTPLGPDGTPATFVILAMGKLGGSELNYSSDVDLVFLYDVDGTTDGQRRTGNAEFFERLARELVGLLTETTELGMAYRVDLRLRPDGERGPMVNSVAGASHYYDMRGRTWERQALIKARAVAGDIALGNQFLESLRPWIYRRYLSRADITGIKALKRRIEQRTRDDGAASRDVKTGHGGIRDIEFVIQFLQLLNGGDLPSLQTGNTLEAIAQLEQVGCLSNQERTLLQENYAFLRKIEHRLQILFDLQTHLLPSDAAEMRKLALRMGYCDAPCPDGEARTALAAFEEDYRSRTDLNRKMLDHLLHDAFRDDVETGAESDLVLDPNPPSQRQAEVLGKHRFRDVKQAYRILMSLGEEKIRFLSTRRCRHFLAAIAPELLRAVAATPDPDFTLVNLDKVSDSLGGKGVLWELFSFNPPSLRMCVEVCAYSDYLTGILTSNPGMIDSLMDSLVLDKLPTWDFLESTLTELCRAAEDLDPILHSFKNDQQLRVGVRDILGKEDVQATTEALTSIARTVLGQITMWEYDRLVTKFGRPTLAEGPREGDPCELVLLGMGKLGGREMNYHSDLDIVFLYEGDGQTVRTDSSQRSQSTTNQHFFSELGQRIIKTAGRLGAYGKLYDVDARLRPTGKSGALATSFGEFSRYFAEGAGQLWERQALCKARVIHGTPRMGKHVLGLVGQAAFEHRWRRQDADEVRRMRQRMEDAAVAPAREVAAARTSEGSGVMKAAPKNLKRGPGGIVDIEFLVQMLQLKNGRRNYRIRTPNTLAALSALGQAGFLDSGDAEFFATSYRYLRMVESRLQLLHATSRDKLPEDPTDLAKLAHLLGAPDAAAVLSDFDRYTHETRSRFNRVFDREGGA